MPHCGWQAPSAQAYMAGQAAPVSTTPSQSLSLPSQISGCGPIGPSQRKLPATQRFLPARQVPMPASATSKPSTQASPSPITPSSMMPLQLSSLPLQISVRTMQVRSQPPATSSTVPLQSSSRSLQTSVTGVMAPLQVPKLLLPAAVSRGQISAPKRQMPLHSRVAGSQPATPVG